MVPLLMHSPDIPEQVREQLRAAYLAGPDQRAEQLYSAARSIHEELDVECEDARELVGLPPAPGCC
jgi:hypothetical protein